MVGLNFGGYWRQVAEVGILRNKFILKRFEDMN